MKLKPLIGSKRNRLQCISDKMDKTVGNLNIWQSYRCLVIYHIIGGVGFNNETHGK